MFGKLPVKYCYSSSGRPKLRDLFFSVATLNRCASPGKFLTKYLGTSTQERSQPCAQRVRSSTPTAHASSEKIVWYAVSRRPLKIFLMINGNRGSGCVAYCSGFSKGWVTTFRRIWMVWYFAGFHNCVIHTIWGTYLIYRFEKTFEHFLRGRECAVNVLEFSWIVKRKSLQTWVDVSIFILFVHVSLVRFPSGADLKFVIRVILTILRIWTFRGWVPKLKRS